MAAIGLIAWQVCSLLETDSQRWGVDVTTSGAGLSGLLGATTTEFPKVKLKSARHPSFTQNCLGFELLIPKFVFKTQANL